MARIMGSESKPLRNIILRLITPKSNTSDGSQICCYARCCELVGVARNPDGVGRVCW
jgi:hypothetical protein